MTAEMAAREICTSFSHPKIFVGTQNGQPLHKRPPLILLVARPANVKSDTQNNKINVSLAIRVESIRVESVYIISGDSPACVHRMDSPQVRLLKTRTIELHNLDAALRLNPGQVERGWADSSGSDQE